MKDKSRKIFMGSVAGILFYSLGGLFYLQSINKNDYTEIQMLNNQKKTELVNKIDEWQRVIPLMKEPYATKYLDSLRKAIDDTTNIDLNVRQLDNKLEKETRKSFYSWGAFFMENE